MDNIINVEKIEKVIGYTFKDKELLKMAFTHPGYANENNAQSYQRLEFLGDSVINCIVSLELYKKYPKKAEGELTKLKGSIVSGIIEAECFATLGLLDEIRYGISGKPDTEAGLNNLSEDVFEALAGAILLDTNNVKDVTKFVQLVLSSAICDEKCTQKLIDYKSRLLEQCAKDGKKAVFVLDGQEGPSHKPTFSVHVEVDGIHSGKGEGGNKKEAEQAASKEALKGFVAVD